MKLDSAWVDARLDRISDLNLRSLLAILRGATPDIWPVPPEVGELLEIADRNRVSPELRTRIASAGGAAPAWARKLGPALEARWMAGAYANAARCSAVKALGEQFANEGVRVVALKGFHLAYAVYPDPADRPFGDVDLLVRPNDVPVAKRILAANGFEDGLMQTGSGAIEASFLKRLSARISLDVDLHWKMVGPLSLVREMRIDEDELFARSTTAFVGIEVPSVEDALVIAAVNLVRHGFRPLGNILDFRELLPHADPATLALRVRSSHTASAMSVAAGLAVEVFGAPPPDTMLPPLPRWQQVLFRRLLRPTSLARPERADEAVARYGLKVLAQDGAAGVLRTVAGLPGVILRRRRPFDGGAS